MPTPDLLAPASPAGAAARRPSLDAAAKDLARTARACWDGDAAVVSEHVAGLAQMGLAASARRVKDHTIAQLLRPLRDEAPEVAGQLAAAIGTDTTLLHVAAARAHWAAVEALLPPQGAGRRPASAGSARGGSSDRCVDTLNDQRCTALLAAVLGGSQAPPEALLRVVGLLLTAGADANAPGVRHSPLPTRRLMPSHTLPGWCCCCRSEVCGLCTRRLPTASPKCAGHCWQPALQLMRRSRAVARRFCSPRSGAMRAWRVCSSRLAAM